jgi:hypothetical protein
MMMTLVEDFMDEFYQGLAVWDDVGTFIFDIQY